MNNQHHHFHHLLHQAFPGLPAQPFPGVHPFPHAPIVIGPVMQPPVFGPAPGFFDARARLNVNQERLPAAVRAILEKPVSYFTELASQKPAPGAQPLTHVAFVLDKSTSMGDGPGKKESTIEGFNTQVSVVRRGAEAAGKTLFTEVQYGSGVEVKRVGAPIESMQPLSPATYVPEGMTALYDGLGDTIAALLATEGIHNPTTATLVTLFTDGGENHSRRYGTEVLRQLVERLEATGRWTFALVGPKGSISTLADLLAIKQANVASYNPDSVQSRTDVFGAVAGASASYMGLRSMGGTQSACLYAGQDAK